MAATRREIAILAKRMETRSADATRHKCFVSYHAADGDEVAQFIQDFGTEFIAKTIGVTDDDPFINSDDDDYIKSQISGKYMADTSVTILLVGACTAKRRFVDWEIAATLRNSPKNRRSGLVAWNLPSVGKTNYAPARLDDNWSSDEPSYASYYVPPTSKSSVRSAIDAAFQARTNLGHLVDNSRVLRRKNSPC